MGDHAYREHQYLVSLDMELSRLTPDDPRAIEIRAKMNALLVAAGQPTLEERAKR